MEARTVLVYRANRTKVTKSDKTPLAKAVPIDRFTINADNHDQARAMALKLVKTRHQVDGGSVSFLVDGSLSVTID